MNSRGLVAVLLVSLALSGVRADESSNLNRLYERVDDSLRNRDFQVTSRLLERAKSRGASGWRWKIAESRLAIEIGQFARAANLANLAFDEAADDEQRGLAAKGGGSLPSLCRRPHPRFSPHLRRLGPHFSCGGRMVPEGHRRKQPRPVCTTGRSAARSGRVPSLPRSARSVHAI